jgi:Fe-S-cluster containining protein
MSDARGTLGEAVGQGNPCLSCGACCAYSENWPRFSTEDETALDRIPQALVNAQRSGMRCEGDRCAALTGQIGKATSCAIYPFRPDVCRACLPGDPECAMARNKQGLPILERGESSCGSEDSF